MRGVARRCNHRQSFSNLESLSPDAVKENSGLEWYRPWWDGDVKQYMVDYIVRMIGQVDEDVELGLHNCYDEIECSS